MNSGISGIDENGAILLMKSDISSIGEMVSVQHLMVANGDSFIDCRNGLIDFGISGIYENGTILLMNSGLLSEKTFVSWEI